MTLLWVTRAALADIGFSDLAGSDVARYRNRHPILDAFFIKRASSPVGTEQLQQVPREWAIWNLHGRNPHRGVTWYDAEADVVYLLAASAHDYAEFVTRAKSGALMPTAEDFVDVALHLRALSGFDDAFLSVVEVQMPDLVERAIATPGVVVEQIIGGELPAAALLEVAYLADAQVTGDVFVALRFSDRLRARELPSGLLAELAPLLLPAADLSDIDWAPQEVPIELRAAPGDPVIRWLRH